ncbi:hypothetical protein F5I97DRAFT_1930905 [Phlebopus sp. FC_14]|nr:hypothetical protein F5I97DRAFT_1930905 [Phlebopus sp. FC_14]
MAGFKLTAFYGQLGEYNPRPRSRSYAYAPKLHDSPWSALSSPPPFPESQHFPVVNDKDPLPEPERKDSFASWRELASPVLLSIATGDSTLREAGFDPSCLDELDEQLLRSPTDCFSDLCWAAAVEDEITTVPVLHTPKPPSRSSFPSRKDEPRNRGVSQLTDPLRDHRHFPAKVRLPRNAFAQCLLSSSAESHVTCSSSNMKQRTILADSETRMLYTNPNESVHYFPVSPEYSTRRRRQKKRDVLPSNGGPHDPHHSQKQQLDTKPSGTLSIISNAYSTLTGRRRTKSYV